MNVIWCVGMFGKGGGDLVARFLMMFYLEQVQVAIN